MSLTLLYGTINLVSSYLGTSLVHCLQDLRKCCLVCSDEAPTDSISRSFIIHNCTESLRKSVRPFMPFSQGCGRQEAASLLSPLLLAASSSSSALDWEDQLSTRPSAISGIVSLGVVISTLLAMRQLAIEARSPTAQPLNRVRFWCASSLPLRCCESPI